MVKFQYKIQKKTEKRYFSDILGVSEEADTAKTRYGGEKMTEQKLKELLADMTLEEKVGQLAHTLGWNYYEKDENGQVRLTDLFRSDLKNRYIGCFWATLRADPWTRKTLRTGLSPREAAEMTNAMQRYARDSTRLGIPLFLAEECPHGHMAIGTTVFPTAIGRASTWNTESILLWCWAPAAKPTAM